LNADAVILDLEDSVGLAAKDAARDFVADSKLERSCTVVRINPAGSPQHEADLEMVKQSGFQFVMAPKAESRNDLEALGNLQVVALCETAAGVVNVHETCTASNVVAMMWGAEDLMASLGGSRSRHSDGSYVDVARHARSQVLLAAGAAGIALIDAVFLDIGDQDGLLAECQQCVADGFTHKACIHPSQVPVVRSGFAPSPEQIAWAKALLQEAEVQENAVFAFQGRMVDEPLLRQAHAVIDRAPAR
jgi:citrate lyase subunit beta/citryl-CoA lyase